MIVYLQMYGDGKAWFEPIDTDNPPAWMRGHGEITEVEQVEITADSLDRGRRIIPEIG